MMKKRMRNTGKLLLIVLYMGVLFGCASNEETEDNNKEQEITLTISSEEEQPAEEASSSESDSQKIEENTNSWANVHESRICYMDGYYYYASQSDHYFLYRVKEDGTSPQCLVKAHVSDICAQDGEVYFVNQSDGYAIYRMNADGTGLEKVYEYGHGLQISAEYVYFYSNCEKEHLSYSEPFLYRMKKDGSEITLIAEHIYQYVLSGRHSSEMRYSGALYCSRYENEGITVYKMDLNGQNTEKICRFGYRGEIAVQGDYIYCGNFYDGRENVVQYCLFSGKMRTFAVSCDADAHYRDYCFYKGDFYGLFEQVEEKQYKISICRVDLRNGNKEIVYEESVSFEDAGHGHDSMSDLYATQQGVFFRRFVSKQEGCRWFGLTEDGKSWELEDKETIPVTLPAEYVNYEQVTVIYALESTQGYEAYLTKDLEFEEYYTVGEDGEGHDPYRICLPQFNSKIAGYEKINRYLQIAYQEALTEKEEFFKMLAREQEEEKEVPLGRYQRTDYAYVYIGEKYVTVGQYANGYWGGIRSWTSPSPITFDRTSGEVVSLETILGMTTQEAVARLTGAVYKHMEGIGWGRFFLKNFDILTALYEPQNFFLFSDGIGIYYGRYDIECGAYGDFLFIVPWEDFEG